MTLAKNELYNVVYKKKFDHEPNEQINLKEKDD